MNASLLLDENDDLKNFKNCNVSSIRHDLESDHQNLFGSDTNNVPYLSKNLSVDIKKTPKTFLEIS